MFHNCCQVRKLVQHFPLKSIFTVRCLTMATDLRSLNSNLSAYMKNGLVEEAQNLFDRMPQRSTVTWNSMIRGYFQNGFSEEARFMYDKMPVRDIFSYNTMISGLMQCRDVKGAEEVFEFMEDERDVVSWNSMISGYFDNGMVDKAVQMFDEMPVKDVVSWNLMLSGLVKMNELKFAENLFGKMPARDVASWTIMVKGFLSAGRIIDARQCFDHMPEKDVQAWNAMIVGYIEKGYVEIAEGLFHKMPERDESSWNEIINGVLTVGRITDGMRYFSEMPQKSERLWKSILLSVIRNGLVKEAHAFQEKYPFGDVVSRTNLIIGYFERGEVKNARKLFELMPADRDTTMWNATMFGFGENDQFEDGVKLFIRMKEEEDLIQDEATFTSILVLCSNMSSLNLGQQIHALVFKEGMDSFVSVSNAIIHMYFRCGSLNSALMEFSSMPCHDMISWNSIICGLAHHGYGEKALDIFQDMRLKGVNPNEITFVGVLSACSHSGLVKEGKQYFEAMKTEYSLQPMSEHYTCIVDLLGRFGLIEEAMNLLEQMKLHRIDISASVWGALLGACRMHKNFKVGEIAGERILDLEPSNSGVYMILVEMLLATGRRNDAGKMWARMKDLGVKKQPGCSWIELNNNSYIFLAGDRTHPQFSGILSILKLVYGEMDTGSSAHSLSSPIDTPIDTEVADGILT